MDPLTAFCNVVIALAALAKTMAEGQTPDQRKVMWDWYLKDIAWWRHALNIDKTPQ